MKPRPITALLILQFVALYASAQSVEQEMNKSRPSCFDMLQNASDLLPKLYRKKSFDSMHYAIEIWKKQCKRVPEIKYTEILLSISERKFSVKQSFDSSNIQVLTEYASTLAACNRYRGMSAEFVNYYKFSSTWAKLLLETEPLDSNERFVCKVFAGDIINPEKEINQNRANYLVFNDLLKQDFAIERSSPKSNLAFTAGVWIPRGNLSVVNPHPTLGMQIGARSKRHEIDLGLYLKFANTANYYVKRSDSLYQRNYFLGGYIGLDYTYYFVSSPRFDIGWVAGVGYDGFDIAAKATQNNDTHYLDPVSISSLNLNTGARINFYFTRSFYIGLQTRYNAVNYCNTGGTDLGGGAFSIDIIFGSNTKDNYR